MAKTAIRRHHRERLIKRWFNDQFPRYYSRGTKETDKHIVRASRMYPKTGTLCSCSMCCSPRYTYGNGIAAKTFQELRSDATLRDYLLEE